MAVTAAVSASVLPYILVGIKASFFKIKDVTYDKKIYISKVFF